ncbi:Nif11-like leader peptide family natural product precursor [Synechococcus sp. NOUM97013]|uniref:Nif11-like leader peptide family natural product precursor n=1 Tax=Synechococcus sp. NOUM97013 TaxID=1442555 RepID=UPI0016456E1D|nr:Nif11-like leader peptide family natural product precursor [Synechococcus sp. NOUM97013]QNI73230.1 lantipeptide precursor/ Nif11-like leader peptide domain protein [Synechococcus sp. NOUM97013]
MPEEQLKAFPEKVKSDTELQEKLKAATTPEAALQIAKEAGFSITAEDIQSMQSQSGEVSDDELEAAAGGGHLSVLEVEIFGCFDLPMAGYPGQQDR